MGEASAPRRSVSPEDVLIEAVLEARRGLEHGQTTAAYHFGPFRLEPSECRLLKGGTPVPLAPREFDTLRLLVEHHGRLVTKQVLLDRVWGGMFVGDDTIAQRVSLVRRALGETPADRYIETVPRRGYRFVAPVTER